MLGQEGQRSPATVRLGFLLLQCGLALGLAVRSLAEFKAGSATARRMREAAFLPALTPTVVQLADQLNTTIRRSASGRPTATRSSRPANTR